MGRRLVLGGGGGGGGGGGVLIFLDRGIPSTGKALKETVNCL